MQNLPNLPKSWHPPPPKKNGQVYYPYFADTKAEMQKDWDLAQSHPVNQK